MKYMLLIYHDEQSWDTLSQTEQEQIYGEYRELIAQLQFCGLIACFTGSVDRVGGFDPRLIWP